MAQSDKVICFGFPKEAALYFEEVLPVDLSYGWFSIFADMDDKHQGIVWDAKTLGVPFLDYELLKGVIASLLPKSVESEELYANQFLALAWAPLALIFGKSLERRAFKNAMREQRFKNAVKMLSAEGGISLPKMVGLVRSDGISASQMSAIAKPKIADFIAKAGFVGCPAWLGFEGLKNSETDGRTSYAMSLSNLNLIDPSACSWEEIIEFRKDKSSMLALKRFRSFFTENFSGKDPTFVSDKLNILMYEYHKAAKLWNFNNISQTISAIATNKNVFGTSIATLAPVLAGAPIGLAAACGTVASLGSCAVSFSKVVADTLTVRNDSPMSFTSRLTRLDK